MGFGDGSLRVDPSGSYLYTIGQTAPIGTIGRLDEIVGFAIDHATGNLTVLPGSPFKIATKDSLGIDLVVTP